jgi:hypothetical protein
LSIFARKAECPEIKLQSRDGADKQLETSVFLDATARNSPISATSSAKNQIYAHSHNHPKMDRARKVKVLWVVDLYARPLGARKPQPTCTAIARCSEVKPVHA